MPSETARLKTGSAGVTDQRNRVRMDQKSTGRIDKIIDTTVPALFDKIFPPVTVKKRQFSPHISSKTRGEKREKLSTKDELEESSPKKLRKIKLKDEISKPTDEKNTVNEETEIFHRRQKRFGNPHIKNEEDATEEEKMPEKNIFLTPISDGEFNEETKIISGGVKRKHAPSDTAVFGDISSDDPEGKTKKLRTKHPRIEFENSKEIKGDGRERFTFFFTKKYVFSNHYQCRFIIDGVPFNCTEQYYMYKKAVHFGDTETAVLILKETDPKMMKKLGSHVRGFDETEWNKESVGRRYMREGNLAKYQQNKDLQIKLFETDGTTLVETSPSDCRWGIGLSMDDTRAQRRETWRGQNWLGEILTDVRRELMHSNV